MKHIKTFESFKQSRNEQQLNEGILGNLFGKMKNKLSLGFSKMFGTAKDVDKLMGEYKKEIMNAEAQKKQVLTDYAKYVKSVKDGGEEDENKAKEVQKNLDKAEANYNKQLDIIKQKFDIKFKGIVKKEENEAIKDYILLKKLEMQGELLQNELSTTLTDAGLGEEDVADDPVFQKLMKGIQSKMENNTKMQQQQQEALKEGGKKEEGGEGEEKPTFDFEAAKGAQKDDKNDYEWDGYKNSKLEAGEELKYLKGSGFKDDGDDYKGTTAWVMPNDAQKDNDGNPVKGGEVRVTTDKDDKENKGFVISKGKIVSTKKDEEAKAKADEEKSKEEENKKEETTETEAEA
jgi:hypothetical protein